MQDVLFENALGLIVSKKANQEDGVKQSGHYEIGVYTNSHGWCHLRNHLEAGDKIVCNKDDAQINVRLLSGNIVRFEHSNNEPTLQESDFELVEKDGQNMVQINTPGLYAVSVGGKFEIKRLGPPVP